MSASLQHDPWSELAVRENDGLAVSLLWSRTSGRVKVAVVDRHFDEQFELHVPGAAALAAFHHPFVYAAEAELCLATERSTVR